MIRLVRLTKRYTSEGPPAVDAIDLDVVEGELLVLLGTSGCGKTTTLKMINQLVRPTSGEVWIEGEDATRMSPHRLRRRVGYVFQSVGLFPHMTVAENVGVTPRLLGWSATTVRDRVAELLELVHLPEAEFARRMPSELSGGQRQRVGVARALAAKPRVMLLDEPFGALDPITRDALQEEFIQIHRDGGVTAVIVTHHMTEALLMPDRIAVMAEGRIAQLGTPRALMAMPANEYVRELISTPKRQADRLEAIAEGAVDRVDTMRTEARDA
jgi:osmoprotectant transport system ATP-binding protein